MNIKLAALIAISALAYSWSATAQTLSVSPISLTFGTQADRTTSAAQTITVTNTGTAMLTVGKVALTGANRASFTISGNTCTSVAPSGTCAISVQFTPPETGAKSANVSIPSNAAGSPTVVGLTGTGVARITVPKVVTDNIDQANTVLYDAGLTLGTQTNASSATVPSGEIISQNPAAGSRVATGTAIAVVVSLGAADTVLYSFTGGSDGNSPYAGVIQASDGNFYGTTTWGGTANYGTVFMITSAGVETVLYSFQGGSDGMNPEAGLVQGSDGDLYGVTIYGGTASAGTVFKISLAGVETVLYSFGSGTDGAYPRAALIQASDGIFYGTTILGGSANLGTVFKITPAGVERVLHSFQGSPDGQYLYSGLTQGRDGKFYGTTDLGGAAGVGTVFKITPAGVETVLYSFQGGSGGDAPQGGLIQGIDGNFFGTTGGQGSAYFGTVFKITPAGVMTVLHVFEGIVDGGNPYARLIQTSDGNFYGTSNYGPTTAGTIFRMTPAGVLTELHAFGNGNDGVAPLYAGLTLGSDGYLYGTTAIGGEAGYGTVFQFNLSAE